MICAKGSAAWAKGIVIRGLYEVAKVPYLSAILRVRRIRGLYEVAKVLYLSAILGMRSV